MIGMIRPSPDLISQLRQALATVVGYTDSPVTVRLVEGEFDPDNPATWPSPSTHFGGRDSEAGAEIHFDAASNLWYLYWPDPTDGWMFGAESITDAVTITGFTVKVGTAKVGATKIGPINITANDQTITLPYVTAAISNTIVIPAAVPTPI